MQIQRVAKIIFVCLTILLVISLFLIFKGEKKDKTKKIYQKICNSSIYSFSIEEGSSSTNKLIISKKGKDKSLDLISEGEHTTTLVKDEYAYFIMHNKEEYSVFENEDMQEIEADILESDSALIDNSKYVTGKEKIYGKTYYFEEYENIDSFIMRGIPIEEDTKLKTRFYFDGDKIEYIKTIIYDEEEKSEELLKVDLSFSVDENLFEIPKNYAEL